MEQSTDRYLRHYSLSEIGHAGQRLLSKTSVLCVGSGGIGSPALLYLAAAGIGNITIIDDDSVVASNLNRQVLFNEKDIGLSKVEQAKKKLALLNPLIKVDAIQSRLTSENAAQIISHHDIVLDGSDNFKTRYIINDMCVSHDKPFVSASIYQFHAQISLFNYHDGPCYRCIYPAPPPDNLIPNCTEAGILGAVCGTVGTIAATEIIKATLGLKDTLSGSLLTYDAISLDSKRLSIRKKSLCSCSTNMPPILKESAHIYHVDAQAEPISVDKLCSLIKENTDPLIIDVREEWEIDLFPIQNAIHIPLINIRQSMLKNIKDRIVVFVCKTQARSMKAASTCRGSNVYYLSGGASAWSKNLNGEELNY